MEAVMAQNTDLNITAKTWTLITDSDVTQISFQNKGGTHILVKSGTSATLPTTFDGAIRYNPGQGEKNALLSDIWPGLASRVRVFVYAYEPVTVFVSHA